MKRVIVGLIACLLAGCMDKDPTAPIVLDATPQAIVLTVPLDANAIATGYSNTCVIRMNRTLACWGDNEFGQSSVPADLGTVQSVSADYTHACAVTTNGAVRCWGTDQYGDGYLVAPESVDGSGEAKRVSVGIIHSCAVRTDDTLVCWGSNAFGQSAVPGGLGTVKQVASDFWNTCAVKTDDTLVCWGANTSGQTNNPVGLGTVKQVAVGREFTCAIKTDDTLACWGKNEFGQTNIPVGLGTVKRVAAGNYFTCAVKSDDSVSCWGRNAHGETNPPGAIGSLTDMVAGSEHVCALKVDKTVVCWGNNTDGQSTLPIIKMTTSAGLAAGGYTSCTFQNGTSIVCWGRNNFGQGSPPAVAAPKQLAVGGFHACAIESDDTVTCWGNNTFGQTSVPGDLGEVKSVVAGHFHNCAITVTDAVACWGNDSAGEATIPIGYETLTVTEVALGQNFTCILANQQVACWGASGSGQLSSPNDLSTMQHVAAGNLHACAVRTDGSVVCWGNNSSGQTVIPGDLGPATRIVAGMDHTCGLRTDGTVACWGSNTLGQTSVPAGLGSVASIAAGRDHTCAVKTDGLTTVCWGGNQYAQSTAPGQLMRYVPTATFTAPASAVSGATFMIELTDAQVVTPEGTLDATQAEMLYAFDCGTGYPNWNTYIPVMECIAGASGTQVVRAKVIDKDGDTREYSANVDIVDVAAAPSDVVITSDWSAAPVLNVSWNDESTNETSFQVHRRSRPEGGAWSSYARVRTTGESETSYEDSDVEQSTTYQYRVRACNAAGCSAFAASGHFDAGLAPSAPENFVATAAGSGVIDLAWSDASIESRYELQRRKRDGTWGAYQVLAPLPANTENFNDTGLDLMSYLYRLRACNIAGCSAWTTSNRQIANTRPAEPSNLVGSALSATSIQITWTDASNNETEFHVQRRQHDGANWGAWGDVATPAANATSFTDNAVSPATRYQYRVRANNAVGVTAYTMSNAVTTPN